MFALTTIKCGHSGVDGEGGGGKSPFLFLSSCFLFCLFQSHGFSPSLFLLHSVVLLYSFFYFFISELQTLIVSVGA